MSPPGVRRSWTLTRPLRDFQSGHTATLELMKADLLYRMLPFYCRQRGPSAAVRPQAAAFSLSAAREIFIPPSASSDGHGKN